MLEYAIIVDAVVNAAPGYDLPTYARLATGAE